MTAPAAPIFTNPSTPGQLSNKTGANTGADSILFGFTYKNPRATGDPIGTIRITVTKPTVPGNPANITKVLDTWWLGAGTQNNLPSALSRGGQFQWGGQANFVYNNRVYVAPFDSSAIPSVYFILSAPVNGPSLGAWRSETIPPQVPQGPVGIPLSTTQAIYSMTQIGGYVYAIFGQTFYYARINDDGTFGTWLNGGTGVINVNERWIIGWSDISGNSWIASGASSRNVVDYAKLNTDGSIGTWASTAAGPANKGRCACWFSLFSSNDGSGTLYLIGGYDGTNASATIHTVAATVAAGVLTLGTPAAAGAPLPAARYKAGFAVINGFAYVVGGSDNSSSQNTIYRIAIGSIGIAGWTTDAIAVGTVPGGHTAWGQAVPGGSTTGGSGTGAPVLYYVGNNTNNVFVAPLNAGTGALLTSAVGAVGAEVTAAQLGITAGVVTNNADGSVSIQAYYQAAGVAASVGAFALGDIATLTVQFTDQQGGDPSIIATTTFKIGPPPTISAVAPSGATADCQPTVSFNYTAGIGGGPEFKYQIQIKNNGGVVVADTGLIASQANIYSPKLYPMLASGLLASTVVTVYSTDTPMPGSLNSATATTTFTPTQAAPSNPGTVSLGIDNVGGALIPSWKDPSGGVAPAFNRLYWRLAGASTWLIAKDAIVATQNVQQNFTLMDTIPMGVAVEIGVSSYVVATGDSESAIVSVGTGTITPDYHQDLGGYTAMLHIVGNGINQRVPLPNKPPIKFSKHIDSSSSMMFGNAAPNVRYGGYSYREIDIDVIPLDSQILTLDTVLAAAQAGGILCYRDTVGTLIYCGLPADRTRTKDLYYADALKLIEIQYTFVP